MGPHRGGLTNDVGSTMLHIHNNQSIRVTVAKASLTRTDSEADEDDDESHHAKDVDQQVVFSYGRRVSNNIRIGSSFEVSKYGALIPRGLDGDPAEQDRMLRMVMAVSERGGVPCRIIIEDEEFHAVLQMVRGEMNMSILLHGHGT